MNRPSVRGLPAGRASDAYQLNEDSSTLEPVSGKVIEDWRFHGDSISSPGALRLMMGQAVQDHLSPSKPHQRIGDNGIINGAMKLEPFTSPDSLKSSALSTSGQSRNRRGYAVSLGTSMLLCFVSVFAFIGLLGTRSPGYNLRLVPTLGIYRSYRRLQAEVVVDPFKGGIFGQGTVRMKELPSCERLEEDSVPCYNSLGNLGSGHMARKGDDRHCEVHKSRKQCLIQPPDDYKIPLRWPASRDGVWHGNMKFTEQFGLSGRRMASLKLGGDDAAILNLGIPDLDGLENHVQQITKAMGANDASQSGFRTVLDINCGLSRLVDHHRFLEKSSILCLAPYEVNGSQVQFALERGFPAMIGSVINTQLPFPSSSFDMIHCFDCDFDWTWKEGLLLLELDRLLKPGGFFIWTYQAALSVDPLMKMHEQDWQTNKELASLICWSALSEADQTVVWKKTADQSCYSSRGLEARPKLCDRLVDANSAWYPPLRPCIAAPTVDKGTHLQQQQQHRVPVSGFSTEELADDSHVWSATVKSYWSLLTPLIFSDHPKRPGEEDPSPPSNIVRNVMDMNAVHGSLNAALLEARKSVWVMNVVPHSGPDTLSIIYKRGLVGVQHDWCEAFPTYPRTYDLLHGIGLLSQEAARPNGCGLSNLFLEMDRILRPEGWVILRDKVELIEDVRIAAGQMRWESRVIEVEGLEDQELLVCQKTFWKSQSSKAVL